MLSLSRHTAAIVALLLCGCAAQQSAIDPAQCQASAGQGGTSAAYTRCLLGQAKDKTVGGMPVLSENARLRLQYEEDNPCRAERGTTTADLLSCEISRP